MRKMCATCGVPFELSGSGRRQKCAHKRSVRRQHLSVRLWRDRGQSSKHYIAVDSGATARSMCWRASLEFRAASIHPRRQLHCPDTHHHYEVK